MKDSIVPGSPSLMNLPHNFADVNTAQELTRGLYPSAKTIVMVEHSYDNIVALVDHRYAVRFPKNKNAYIRSLYEKHILEHLENIETITIPRILDEYADPPCLVTSFVPGHHVSGDDVRKFSKNQQNEFAKQVAQFAYSMHSAFSIDKEIPLRKQLGLDELEDFEPWPMYFKKTVYDNASNNHLQEEIAKSYYADWTRLCDIAPNVVVHDDLHTQNMMFTDNRLIGIIDFSDTNIGTPEQDLRQLYRINEEIIITAAEEYQSLSGRELSLDAIKIWSVMKELAVYFTALKDKTQTTIHLKGRAETSIRG